MHEPVLLQETIDYLQPAREDGTIVDATVGLGGHAEALLERYEGSRLIAIDRDPAALERSRERLKKFGNRVTFHRGRHESLIDILKQSNTTHISGILADLGVSSMQLDNPDRGFTYKESGPLDMRMNPARGETASRFLAHQREDKLARLLEENADEPDARLLARALTAEAVPTTGDLPVGRPRSSDDRTVAPGARRTSESICSVPSVR